MKPSAIPPFIFLVDDIYDPGYLASNEEDDTNSRVSFDKSETDGNRFIMPDVPKRTRRCSGINNKQLFLFNQRSKEFLPKELRHKLRWVEKSGSGRWFAFDCLKYCQSCREVQCDNCHRQQRTLQKQELAFHSSSTSLDHGNEARTSQEQFVVSPNTKISRQQPGSGYPKRLLSPGSLYKRSINQTRESKKLKKQHDQLSRKLKIGNKSAELHDDDKQGRDFILTIRKGLTNLSSEDCCRIFMEDCLGNNKNDASREEISEFVDTLLGKIRN